MMIEIPKYYNISRIVFTISFVSFYTHFSEILAKFELENPAY